MSLGKVTVVMADFRKLWLMLPRWVRQFPRDLAAAVGLVGATAVATALPETPGAVLQILFGVPFVFLAPGYALAAALFPGVNDPEATASDEGANDASRARRILSRTGGGISASERLVVSAWLSVIVVPLLGLVVNFLPISIRPATVLVAVGGFVVAMSVVAAVRRWDRPPEERFDPTVGGWRDRVELAPSRFDLALNVVLAGAILLAVGSVSYAVMVPDRSQSFTEFYLLSENETGDLVADDYPDEFQRGQSESLTVGIDNHENQAMNYTVVVLLQRVEEANGTTRVIETSRIDRFRAYVEPNSMLHRQHAVTPEMEGTNLRLRYLLYRGDPSPNPTADSAYRNAHIWINVTSE
jgi:uncharacterized membrane protein